MGEFKSALIWWAQERSAEVQLCRVTHSLGPQWASSPQQVD